MQSIHQHVQFMIRNFFILYIIFISSLSFAQPKAGYYDAAVGKVQSGLKSELYRIISTDYVTNTYDFLYTIYETSDVTTEGKIWDMYSYCDWTPNVKKCGNYSSVCDCYNREHTIPQSWFNEALPMRTDAFHVYPTDGRVNGQRSNYPYGECASGSTLTNGKGKLGNSTFAGYSGTVFEPVDEYKGDLARTYFYFATRYENIMTTIGGDSFNKTVYPALSTWTVNLFLKWHRQDPVSQKEIDRNNAIEVHQKNRNPFIDHPELAEFIWGDLMGSPWTRTSLNEVKINFSVHPNPVRDVLQVTTDEQNLNYIIYTVSGQELRSGQLPSDKNIVVSDLQSGMYLLQLNADKKQSIGKFVVN